jgi:hypothetical protein
MTTTITADNGTVSGSVGLKSAADSSGILALQADNPFTRFPENETLEDLFLDTEANLSGETIVPVEPLPLPEIDNSKQTCVQNTVSEFQNGSWVLTWNILDLPSEQIAENEKLLISANKSLVQKLLSETDWVELPSVANPANIPHLLNASDFFMYRNALRAIAVNPPRSAPNWPKIPH